MTLYLKYRPQRIDDLDLQSVRESLSKMLMQESIPHAFLFAGPKGTGKTSAARILAKALNCEQRTESGKERKVEPCNECPTCVSITRGENLDVIEIDAASHRGIDDIRMLREAVKLAPVSAARKVYIIDEAHMLTTEACNALLKILEEPPLHVVFVLATTNPEKLIDTIRSRTRLVQFTKATEDDVVRRLVKVAEGEKIEWGEEILRLIAKASDGAFRDGVKLFEQLISEQVELTKDDVSEFLFGKKSFDPEKFLQKLMLQDAKGSLDLVEHGVRGGVSAKQMTKGILEMLRERLMSQVGAVKEIREKKQTVELLELFSKAYGEIPGAYLEQLPLEIAVMKWCNNSIQFTAKKDEAAPVTENKEENQETSGRNQGEKVERKRLTKDTDAVIKDSEIFPDATWVKVISEVRPRNASTEALLRACKPMTFDGKVLTVGVFYKFHKERLESHPHRDLLEDVLEELLGVRVRVSCTLTEPPAREMQEEVTKSEVVLTETKGDDKIVDIAKDIFGG